MDRAENYKIPENESTRGLEKELKSLSDDACRSLSVVQDQIKNMGQQIPEELLKKIGETHKMLSDLRDQVQNKIELLDQIPKDTHGLTDGKDGRISPKTEYIDVKEGENARDVLMNELRSKGFHETELGDKKGFNYQMVREINTDMGLMQEHIRFNEPVHYSTKDDGTNIYRVEILGELHRDRDGNILFGKGEYGDLEPTFVSFEHGYSFVHEKIGEVRELVDGFSSRAQEAINETREDLSDRTIEVFSQIEEEVKNMQNWLKEISSKL